MIIPSSSRKGPLSGSLTSAILSQMDVQELNKNGFSTRWSHEVVIAAFPFYSLPGIIR